MANQYQQNAIAQCIWTDGDRYTSNVSVSGSLRIDWNKYLQGKGLLECLEFGTREVDCNVPDPTVLTLAGDTGA